LVIVGDEGNTLRGHFFDFGWSGASVIVRLGWLLGLLGVMVHQLGDLLVHAIVLRAGVHLEEQGVRLV
jgi:hypothetical protein